MSYTVGQLIAELEKFPADTVCEINGSDGPEYGWIDIGEEETTRTFAGRSFITTTPIAQISSETFN